MIWQGQQGACLLGVIQPLVWNLFYVQLQCLGFSRLFYQSTSLIYVYSEMQKHLQIFSPNKVAVCIWSFLYRWYLRKSCHIKFTHLNGMEPVLCTTTFWGDVEIHSAPNLLRSQTTQVSHKIETHQSFWASRIIGNNKLKIKTKRLTDYSRFICIEYVANVRLSDPKYHQKPWPTPLGHQSRLWGTASW